MDRSHERTSITISAFAIQLVHLLKTYTSSFPSIPIAAPQIPGKFQGTSKAPKVLESDGFFDYECAAPNKCIIGYLEKQTCSPPIADGGGCNLDSQCSSGKCNSGFKCTKNSGHCICMYMPLIP